MIQVSGQVGRYLLVQVFAYCIDYGIFVLSFLVFALDVLVSNVLSKLAAGAVAFFLHRYFTFSGRVRRAVLREAIPYALILFLNIPIASGILVILSYIFPDLFAKLLSDAICVAVNFLLSRLIVFRSASGSAGWRP